MDLIIVESPSKAKTITKYLKGKYKVDASTGHVRDLPEKTLGIKITENFEPHYEITPSKKDIIKRLSAEAKKAGLVSLKGHRLVGGMRASIYNAMPVEGVKALIEFMKKFEMENK